MEAEESEVGNGKEPLVEAGGGLTIGGACASEVRVRSSSETTRAGWLCSGAGEAIGGKAGDVCAGKSADIMVRMRVTVQSIPETKQQGVSIAIRQEKEWSWTWRRRRGGGGESVCESVSGGLLRLVSR